MLDQYYSCLHKLFTKTPFGKKIFDKLLIYDIAIMTTGKFRGIVLVRFWSPAIVRFCAYLLSVINHSFIFVYLTWESPCGHFSVN